MAGAAPWPSGMSRPAPSRYRALSWSGYDAALRVRGSSTVRCDPSTPWHAALSSKRGAQLVYSDSAIQACPTIKVLFGLPLRQTTGFMERMLRPAGHAWCRRAARDAGELSGPTSEEKARSEPLKAPLVRAQWRAPWSVRTVTSGMPTRS
nr:transposase [Roseisalinus antarcticus]